jgi:hypothetical protein
VWHPNVHQILQVEFCLQAFKAFSAEKFLHVLVVHSVAVCFEINFAMAAPPYGMMSVRQTSELIHTLMPGHCRFLKFYTVLDAC